MRLLTHSSYLTIVRQMEVPKYWGSWRGRIIRAIAVDLIYIKDEIRSATGLTEQQLEKASSELLQTEVISERDGGRYWVNHQLCNGYREFCDKRKASFTGWFSEYKRNKGLPDSSHCFVEDKHLEELSMALINKAEVEVLVTNPFIERCHLSNTLIEASKRKVPVVLVTRPIYEKDSYRGRKEAYHRKLRDSGVAINPDNAVHAKILVADRAVAVVSSMNLSSSSSGGGSWEAGIVTTDENILTRVVFSIHKRLGIFKWA